jgi:hypothetical protein
MGLLTIGDEQHVPAQIEQPCQLVAPGLRHPGAIARHGREVARHQADDEERKQRNPVVADRRSRNAPTGGKKKKLKASIAAIEVVTATHKRDVAATSRTTIR